MGKKISSIDGFIKQIQKDYAKWGTMTFPWFRGEPQSDTPLLPKLYRQKHGDSEEEKHRENILLQQFRLKAPSLDPDVVPMRKDTDQWLFLAQHAGLPTRLLDWTEGALIALYFALGSGERIVEKGGKRVVEQVEPIVWMLDSVQLNSFTPGCFSRPNELPIHWNRKADGSNAVAENIQGAWQEDACGVELPLSTPGTGVHPRIAAQRSCFTVQGKKKESLNKLLKEAKDSLRTRLLSLKGKLETQLRETKEVPEGLLKEVVDVLFALSPDAKGKLKKTVLSLPREQRISSLQWAEERVVSLLQETKTIRLIRYEMETEERERMKKELRILGIHGATVYPELDGLARDLGEHF